MNQENTPKFEPGNIVEHKTSQKRGIIIHACYDQDRFKGVKTFRKIYWVSFDFDKSAEVPEITLRLLSNT